MITQKIFLPLTLVLLSATAFIHPKKVSVSAHPAQVGGIMAMTGASIGSSVSTWEMPTPDLTAEVGDEIRVEVDRVQLPQNCRFKFRYEVANPDEVFYQYEKHPKNPLIDESFEPYLNFRTDPVTDKCLGGQAVTHHRVMAHKPGTVIIKYNRLTDTGCERACAFSNNPGKCVENCQENERTDPNNINKNWTQKIVTIQVK